MRLFFLSLTAPWPRICPGSGYLLRRTPDHLDDVACALLTCYTALCFRYCSRLGSPKPRIPPSPKGVSSAHRNSELILPSQGAPRMPGFCCFSLIAMLHVRRPCMRQPLLFPLQCPATRLLSCRFQSPDCVLGHLLAASTGCRSVAYRRSWPRRSPWRGWRSRRTGLAAGQCGTASIRFALLLSPLARRLGRLGRLSSSICCPRAGVAWRRRPHHRDSQKAAPI